jgi:hypothetical protein
MKPIVYIASPYTKGDPAINTHCQLRAFHELMDDGIVWPVVPLLSHFLHIQKPRKYQDWIDYDLALLDRYDACYRINAEVADLDYCVTDSSGADGEVARFKAMGKPVFYDLEALYVWANPFLNQKVVGLCGHAGAGKDEAARGLVEIGWERVSIADAVRDAVVELDPLIHSDNCLVVTPLSNVMAEFDNDWNVVKKFPDVRRLLQRMGVEAGRNIHGENCWVSIAKRKIAATTSNVVITDVRFPTEVALIRELGGEIIRIEKPGICPVNDHPAEHQPIEADHTITNDGTIEQLHDTIRQLVSAELEAA